LAGAAPSTRAQAPGGALGLGGGDKPTTIEADKGIEWQQNNHLYIARGNARATRGQGTVYADTLFAYYRPVAPAQGGTQPAAAADPKGNDALFGGGGSTEIYRVEADGNVRFATETQTVYGDHAVYDVDQAILVVTGHALKLVTPRDVVTARDSLEWFDKRQLAVARGAALAIREGKKLYGDVLTAELEKPPNEPAHISRIDAQGHVLVSSMDQIARGDAGVYNLDTGIATLTGNVTLTRGDNELRGRYAVVDTNNNVSRLLSTPPSAEAAGGKPARVEGLLVPRPKPATQP
jgi:lipopolysaccharide export system protein LptA